MRAHVSHQVNDFKRQPEESDGRKNPSKSTSNAAWRRRNTLFSLVLLSVIAFRLIGPAQTAVPVGHDQRVVQSADWLEDLLELLRIISGIGGGSGSGGNPAP